MAETAAGSGSARRRLDREGGRGCAKGLKSTALGVIKEAMKAVAGEGQIADVQDQDVRPVRRPRGTEGCGVVRGCPARPRWADRRRPRRRRHQAADRPQGRWPVRRVPYNRGVPPGRAGVLRARVCEERPGEPSAQGALGAAFAGGRVSGVGRGGSRGRAGGWRDNRGGMR